MKTLWKFIKEGFCATSLTLCWRWEYPVFQPFFTPYRSFVYCDLNSWLWSTSLGMVLLDMLGVREKIILILLVTGNREHWEADFHLDLKNGQILVIYGKNGQNTPLRRNRTALKMSQNVNEIQFSSQPRWFRWPSCSSFWDIDTLSRVVSYLAFLWHYSMLYEVWLLRWSLCFNCRIMKS